MPRYIGLSFPFRQASDEFPASATDDDLIKESILQLIMVGRGERLMRPDVGSNVFSFVFEPSDILLEKNIQQDITNVISKYEPRVTLTGVVVTRGSGSDPFLPEGHVLVDISWVVNASQKADQVQLSFGAGAPTSG